MFLQKVEAALIKQDLNTKYRVIAKSSYLEDQISDFQDKLKAFKQQKPKMVETISYLEMSISDLQDEWSKLIELNHCLKVLRV